MWRGRVNINRGRFEQPRSLGLARDDAGTITIERKALVIRRRSPRPSDGFEVSVSASPEAILEFELGDEWSSDPPLAIQLSLADCLQKPRVFAADSNRPRVVVRRVPGDALAVSFDRPHLVFDPEETFRVAVGLNLVEARATPDKPIKATLKWKLQPAEGGRPVAEGSTTVTALVNAPQPAQVPIELRLPREEGAYNLRLMVSGREIDDVERVVQLVVVEPTPVKPTSGAGRSEKLVDSFEPQSAGMFRKTSINSLRQKHDHAFPHFLNFRRPRDELDRDVAEQGEINRVAYKLHVTHPGHPHRLEVSFPPGVEQTVVVSIVQVDAHGHLDRAGPEGLLSLAASNSGAGPERGEAADQPRVYRQIFWPQDREPAIVISSRRARQPIDAGRVLLYDLGEALPRDQPVPEAPAGVQLPPRKRLVGGYLHQPALAANFGAPQFFDADERTHLEDWQTFLLAGRRLAELLRYQQQSALMLAVFAEGATIYPSRLIDSSLRYDSGRLASNGQDPVQKDVLELLLRICDRTGLALVPELQFDAPLSAIERLLREHADSPGDLQLVNGAGHPRAEAHEESAGATPGYNILSPRVQQAVLEVVRELLERYRQHPSLAGVAFELNPRSFVQLPNLEWGYDRETIRRFEQATRMQVPHGEGKGWRQEAYQFLTTTARREWLRFRCAEVARFHRSLSELVASSIPDGRVIFSGHLAPLGDSDSEAAVLDVVRLGANPVQLLQGQGLNFSQATYAAERKVIVLRPLVQNAAADKLGLAALATLNDSPAIDALYRGGGRGGLLYSVPDAKSPALREAGSRPDAIKGLAPQAIPRSDTVPRRYAHLLATLDAQVIFEGGETIALTADKATRRQRQTIASLPDVPFQFAGPQVQPVVVRAAHLGNATYLYAANDSSLELTIELVLDCPPTTICRSLETGKLLTLEAGPGEGKCRLQFETAGHQLIGCRLDRAGVAVMETKLTLSEERLAGVHHQIDSLSARMNATVNPARAGSISLSNAGFGADEVRQLTKTLASVKLAWEEQRYADCQRLLDGYWGQLLLYEPVAPPAVSPPRTRIGDRMRNVLRR